MPPQEACSKAGISSDSITEATLYETRWSDQHSSPLFVTRSRNSGIRTTRAARAAGRKQRQACPGKREEGTAGTIREAGGEERAPGREECQAGREKYARTARPTIQP